MSITVLAIDDTKSVVDVIRLFLEGSGFTVKGVTDPNQGIALAQAGGIDLILLDIIMPEMDGYQVWDRLKGDDSGDACQCLSDNAPGTEWKTHEQRREREQAHAGRGKWDQDREGNGAPRGEFKEVCCENARACEERDARQESRRAHRRVGEVVELHVEESVLQACM